jgi:HAD superfamily phosphoserine phosphatase-like hydrolase
MQLPPFLRAFSPLFRRDIIELLASPAERKIACFDADGTLWSEDIGEAFLRWLLAGPLEHLVAKEPRLYEIYEERVRKNLTDGYGWAVQLMAGLAEKDVQRWAKQHAAAWPNYRHAMLGLMRGLAEGGLEVWIVSASNHWVIAAAAARIGIDPSRTIAIRTEVVKGTLTDRLIPPIPCEGGKVLAIDKWIGKRPDMALGDGLGDLAMLEVSTRPLVVGSRLKRDAPLVRRAQEHRWPVHLF